LSCYIAVWQVSYHNAAGSSIWLYMEHYKEFHKESNSALSTSADNRQSMQGICRQTPAVLLLLMN
jgi:hypothetical protein